VAEARRHPGRILLAGTGRFFRNLDSVLVLVAGNACVLAAIVWAVPVERASRFVYLGATVISIVGWLVLAGLVSVMGLNPEAGHLGPRGAVSATLPRIGRVVPWGAVVVGAMAVAAYVFTWLVPVVALIGCMVPAAAAAGAGNPLSAGLRALFHRPWRVVAVGLVVAVLLTVLGVFMGLWSLLLPTPLAQFLVLCVEGLVVSWALLCLARVFVAAAPQDEPPRPQGDRAPAAAEPDA